MSKSRYTAVQLGRFAPYHNGHQIITELMITKYGLDNCIIMIGSSNVLNQRTPYTYEFRKNLINNIYPNLKILPLPDINPTLNHFETNTIDKWLAQIRKIEKELATQFIFVSGSKEDIFFLKDFKTDIIGDRNKGEIISATLIRDLLNSQRYSEIKRLVNPKNISMLINYNIKF